MYTKNNTHDTFNNFERTRQRALNHANFELVLAECAPLVSPLPHQLVIDRSGMLEVITNLVNSFCYYFSPPFHLLVSDLA